MVDETAFGTNDLPPAQVASLSELRRQIQEAGTRRYELVRGVFNLVGDKWGIPILLVLATGRIRHSALRRTLDSLLGKTLSDHQHISQRILTLKLRTFEQLGLIVRRVSEDVPPKVDYALTEMGQELAEQVLRMVDWINLRYPENETTPAACTDRIGGSNTATSIFSNDKHRSID